MRPGTPGFDTNALTEQGLLKVSSQSHIRASIILEDSRNRARFTNCGIPILLILGINECAAFFKIPAAIVVPIKEFTLAAVRSLHVGLNPGQVFTSAGIHTDGVSLVDEGRGLHF